MKTDKVFWESDDFELMMNKTRPAIHRKVESMTIDLKAGNGLFTWTRNGRDIIYGFL